VLSLTRPSREIEERGRVNGNGNTHTVSVAEQEGKRTGLAEGSDRIERDDGGFANAGAAADDQHHGKARR